MTLTPIKCEARLMGLSKVDRKDGEWTQLTFQIHPNDTPYALFLLPLKTHVMLSIKGTEEEAPEAPTETERPKGEADKKLIKQAGILPTIQAFRIWLEREPTYRPFWLRYAGQGSSDQEVAEQAIRDICEVESRAHIRFGETSGERLQDIYFAYRASQHGTTPEAQEQQLNEGRR